MNLMSKKALVLVSCSVVVVALVLCSASPFKAGPLEPMYRGFGLSRWLDGSLGRTGAMGQVLRSVGPEALPWLVNKVERSKSITSGASRSYDRIWLKSAWAKSWLPNPGTRWFVEYNSVSLLGRLAPGTSYENRAMRAIMATKEENNRAFDDAKHQALGCFTNSANSVIPVLVAELTNNTASFDSTIEALQKFGSLVTPSIYPIALKEIGQVRPAEFALQKIDERSYQRLCEEKARLGVH